MYLARPRRATRSTSPGAGPKPRRFSTWTIVRASGFDGTADRTFPAVAGTAATAAIATVREKTARMRHLDPAHGLCAVSRLDRCSQPAVERAYFITNFFH